MVVNKFGKLCGPGAESVPTANSVTTDKIFDGTIAAADLGALSVTAAKLGVDVAGDGLAGGNGAAISLDIDNLTDAVLDVAADTICFIDESADGDPTKLESVADLVTAVAGTASSTALTASGGVLTVSPTEVVTDVAADSLIIRDATDSKVHRDTIADVVGLMAGSAATTGLSSTGGVLTVAAKIAHLVAGEASSLFFFAKEFDFSGSANLVATKISDHAGATALAAKGTLVAAFVAVTQIANGTTSNVISIAKDGTPTAKLCGDCTITLADCTNKVGSVFMLMPVTGANAVIDPASEDIYAVADASATRSAGKVYILLVFQKTA